MVVLYFILIIISVLFYILYEGAFSFYLFCFMISLPVIMNIMLSICKRKLIVSFMEAGKTAGRNDSVPVIIKIENPVPLPIPNCAVTIEYSMRTDRKKESFTVNTPVFPKNVQYLTFSVSAQHYGMIKLRITRIRLVDMLRLFRRTVKFNTGNPYKNETSVMILPDYIQLENPVANYADMGLDADTYSKTQKGDDPSEIFDIHEYVEGDKISRIHWKLSAKQDKTMVKDYSLPMANSVLIAVDLNISSEKLDDERLSVYDMLIDCTAAVSMRLADSDCPHRVTWFDSRTSQRVTKTVSSFDEYMLMITALLGAQTGECSERILEELINDEESSARYGHMIFCTAEVSERSAALASSCGQANRITVLSMCGNAEKCAAISDEKCTAVSVVPGAVAESIQDICL